MHKKLLLVLAVLIASFLMVSCKEEAGGNKVDPKVLAATLEKAMNTADSLDNMNTRAFQMGQVGAAMAGVDSGAASKALEEALTVAKEPHAATYKAVLAGLKSDTASWSPAELEQVAPAIARMELSTTRTWVIASIADGMSKLDKGKAMAVLGEAVKEAESVPDKKYRDIDLKNIAVLMVASNKVAASEVAGKIADPRYKAWALTEMGKETGDKALLASAGEVAVSIQRMEPSSQLVTDETPADVKEKVMAAEKAKLAAASAKALAGAAIAMNALDPQVAKGMLDNAAAIASGIAAPYTKAYAMSDVAMAMADSDPDGAVALANKIEDGHEDAKFAALLKAAKVTAAKKGAADPVMLDNAVTTAKNIADPFERSKALLEAGKVMVRVSKEKALDIADEMDPEVYRDPKTTRKSDMGNEVRAAVAVSLSKDNDKEAKEVLEKKIVEPRFAKNTVLYTKAKAMAEMAEMKSASNPEEAKKLFDKAAGAAQEAGSTQLMWRIAAGLCKLDSGRLFDMALKIEGDDYSKAMGLSEIAADLSAKNDPKAPMVWDLAVKAAAGIDDKAVSAELLKTVGSRCAQYDKARASVIFAKAMEKAVKIGVKEG